MLQVMKMKISELFFRVGVEYKWREVKKTRLTFSLTQDPVGIKNTTPTFQANFFYMFRMAVLTKVSYGHFEISTLNLKKKLTCGQLDNESASILEMARHA